MATTTNQNTIVLYPNYHHCGTCGFNPNDKGEPNNVEEAICTLCHKKVPVRRAANTTNLQIHRPQQYAELGNKTAVDSSTAAGL